LRPGRYRAHIDQQVEPSSELAGPVQQFQIDGLDIGDFTVEVVRSAVRNLNLRVLPPQGQVRISVPWYVSLGVVREFVLSKRDWIETHRRKIQEMEPPAIREYADGEIRNLLNGRRPPF
jgi:predicted metal-dependent hydrolase